MKPSTWTILLPLATLAFACGSDAVTAPENDLTQGGKMLIGAYLGPGEGPLHGLVLTSSIASSNANRFFADLCLGNGQNERVEGTFTGGTKTITLKSETASQVAQAALGKYDYQFDGSTLSLSRSGANASLAKVDSYCGEPSAAEDCQRQVLDHTDCDGAWMCSAEASCGWSCGGGGGAGGSSGTGGDGSGGGVEPTIDCSGGTILHYEFHNQIFGSYLDISSKGAVLHVEHVCCPPSDDPKDESPIDANTLSDLDAWIEAASKAEAHVESGLPTAEGSLSGTLQVCTGDKKGVVVRDVARNDGGLDIVTQSDAAEAKLIRTLAESIVDRDMY